MMNKNTSTAICSILGASGVALGALAAHALKNMIGDNFTLSQFDAFDTATKYQLIHAIVLLIVISMNENVSSVWLRRSINFLISGILFFSGSIYFLSTQQLIGISLPKFIGILTPIGGILLIAGWICIGMNVSKMKKESSQPKKHE